MTYDRDSSYKHPVTTTLEALSKGIDRILKRWPEPNKPSKLSLLNDLAQAIRPGANWGALKSQQREVQPAARQNNMALIPRPGREARTLPARMFPIDAMDNGSSIFELSEDVKPLFGMTHRGHPIVGLVLSAWDGNGSCDISIFTRFVLVKDGQIVVETAHAWEMSANVGHLVLQAVQNLQWTNLYPTYAQSDCSHLCVLVGPFYGAAALPGSGYRRAGVDVESQGLRLLFDPNEVPSLEDIDTCLRLASSSLQGLELEAFPSADPIQFRISQPRMNVWSATDFPIPELLDGRDLFRPNTRSDWSHGGDFMWKRRVSKYGKLGEALDLALTLIDVDDPEVYLHVHLTSEPKSAKNARAQPGWRGGMVKGWRVLKMELGSDPMILSLDEETEQRLAAGLHGWAKNEGYSVETERPKQAVEALIFRDARRASHHLDEVQAIMDSIT